MGRAPDVTLPNLLVIGAMKAGTTALHDYLGAHPQIFMSRRKELKFFSNDLNWRQGVEWYRSHFEQAPGHVRVGESSPHYTRATQFPGVPERIASVLPDVRFIYLVRDPIERIRSAYLHRVSKGKESRSLEEAVARDEPYVNDSRYAWQLDHYLRHFHRARILVVESERLRDERAETLARILGFLEVDSDPELCGSLPDVHVTSHKREFHPAVSALTRVGQPVKSYLPHRWKKRLARVGSRPLATARATLSSDVDRDLRGRLRDDVRRLRDEYLGPAFHGWGIA
jgi:hypothetical protein